MIIILQVIAGIIGYIIISIIATILLIYADRKAGEPAQKIYKEDSFYEYYTVGFLFPLSIPCVVIGIVFESIQKFIKIMCVAIVETKIAIEENKE